MVKKLITLVTIIASQQLVAQNIMPLKSTYEVNSSDTEQEIILKSAHVVPKKNQLEALRNEYIAFIHVGPNTFTRMEWGNGFEDPKIFDLKTLDTDQWCKTMKNAGMKMVIITVKHHDGFVLWQSRYTKHGIMSSPYKNGQGDMLKELAESCKKFGIKLGVYLSPADLFQIESAEGLYGNLSKYTERVIPRPIEGRPFLNPTKFKFKVDDYNEYFLNQLFELLTEYGPIHEVWFDGAHPKTKGGQKYNYLAWKELIGKLAPNAVVFGKEDIRWCGNEDGKTRNTEWNTIAYNYNPDTANYFPDLTKASLGNREDLLQAKFIHYQPAETNTSIREGWFYRDDTDQKVRNADDVFDIYERSVGGNSIFLLNIPPNREGTLSPRDVEALEEAGRRIQKTYGTNLLSKARGSKEVLDNDTKTFRILDLKGGELVFELPKKTLLNRFLIQESIETHGERVEAHALDAWLDGKWKEIAQGTNIGYKRILRFPEVETSKMRLRVTKARYYPAIATVSAHYYEAKPPQLAITSDKNGFVSISPKLHNFNWNNHGQNPAANLNKDIVIKYSVDGSAPSISSLTYTKPFVQSIGEVKAVAFNKNEKGSVASEWIGIPKKDWTIVASSSEIARYKASNAFDANDKTYWGTDTTGASQSITIDLGKEYVLNSFAYTPQTFHRRGMLEKGRLLVSVDNINWTLATDIVLGNMINDPSKRRIVFPKSSIARYIKLESSVIAEGGKSLNVAELDFYGE
jgi:alpha-L-fucosidase